MCFGRCVVYVAILSATLGVVRVRAQAPAPSVVCVTGVIDGTARDGTAIQTVLDMLLVVPAGQDQQTATAAALQAAGARAPGLFDIPLARQPFVANGYLWPQLFDKSKLNNLVTQLYNPAADPTGGQALAPFLKAQATWSAVRGSSFRYAYGGQTTLGVAVDGINTISWSPPVFGGDVLGITTTIYRLIDGVILDADIQLFLGFPWHVDGTDFDVQAVVLHELGHALGLGHSPYTSSIMYAAYQGVRRTLDVIDTDSVVYLYPAHAPAPPPPPLSASDPFQLVTALGNFAPGGLLFLPLQLDVGDLNAGGNTSFAADVGPLGSPPTGQGTFVASTRGIAQLERTQLAAPGGGEFASVAGRVTLNDAGDAAFASVLEQPLLPLGTNAGVYHWDSSHGQLSAVVVPGVTSVPGGGMFQGAYGAAIANAGTSAFGGIINTTAGISGSLGMGVFEAAKGGAISIIAAPGTLAPGGGVFDFAGFPTIGGAGDIGFAGHVRGQPCLTPYPQTSEILCLGGAYVKLHNGGIERIAGSGDPAPGGGIFSSAGSPLVNASGDVVFAGDLTPAPYLLLDVGLFLWNGKSLTAIIRPGEPLPEGGHLVTTGAQPPQFSLDDSGEVAFAATLDTDNGAGVLDTGVYVWTAHGGVKLIARTGTVVPGLGTIGHINSPSYVGSRMPTGGAVLNSSGHVLFTATLTDGLGVLLIAERENGIPPNLQPTILGLSPASAPAGSQSLVLTISGSDFVSSSSVTFNGVVHPAFLTSGGNLNITLSASDLATTGTFPLVVTNPPPGGGPSTPALFTVASTAGFTGNWSGSWSAGSLTANLTQSGSGLTGTASFTGSPCFTSGPVSGTVTGKTASASIAFGGGQTLAVNATLNASELAINGTFTLQGGTCAPGASGTFSLTRQP